jgi:WD repeat-containing protein 42A
MRMNQYGQLRGHGGCVNTLNFNPAGDLLVSGSDDTDIILWDWLAKAKRLSYPSGHEENVLHARVMPYTDDSAIVTAAADGQVCLYARLNFVLALVSRCVCTVFLMFCTSNVRNL